MSIEDEIGRTTVHQKTSALQRGVIGLRFVIYLQLIALITAFLVGQSEQWGYGELLETGMLGMLVRPVVGAVAWSALLFPVVVFAVLLREKPPVSWSWATSPLSVAMSFAQFVALAALVQ
jgi:hypothetical protein